MISSGQFQGLADIINRGGGFSFKVAGPKGVRGRIARDGYMVGLPGYGQDFQPGAVSGTDLSNYAASQHAVLSQPDVYMGGWQGQDPLRGSVDASRRYDRSASGLVSARDAAVVANQEAIGEVNERGGYVGDIMNPYYQAGAGHSEKSRLNLFEDSWIQTGAEDPAAVDALKPKKKRHVGDPPEDEV